MTDYNKKPEPKTDEDFEKETANFKYVEDVFNYARQNQRSLNDEQIYKLYRIVVKFDLDQIELHRFKNVHAPQFKKLYPFYLDFESEKAARKAAQAEQQPAEESLEK
ncbi:MAG: hypothetical protein K6F08_02655 [bacterium]|nr:hypothetical protein [bacterium]